MNLDAMRLGQFRDQFIKRDLALGRNTGRDPISHARQFAMPATVALWARRQCPSFAAQFHPFMDEFRRHAEMPRRLAVPVTFVDIGDNPRP